MCLCNAFCNSLSPSSSTLRGKINNEFFCRKKWPSHCIVASGKNNLRRFDWNSYHELVSTTSFQFHAFPPTLASLFPNIIAFTPFTEAD
jgi:hypothetical protein